MHTTVIAVDGGWSNAGGSAGDGTGLEAYPGMFHKRLFLRELHGGCAMPVHALLPHRALVAVRGADRAAFLQGLISNDVARARNGTAIWAAFLTPQGKFLHEFFVFSCPDAAGEDTLWLECETLRRGDLV